MTTKWSNEDSALRNFVEEQQSIAIRTYEVNPMLLREHVAQEDSFRSGGYSDRQVPELLQNAVDALTEAHTSGRIEFRLADGALYCANEGGAFAQKGVNAICYAFLSPKRDEEVIGRFGLGFKSVVAITDRPQVFSRSVSFGFNSPTTAELFAGIPAASGRLPLLRVPSLIDAEAEAASDKNLVEMMEWATTIVKLPLEREGARIRKELDAFDLSSLLFMKSVEQLVVSLKVGEALKQSVYRRNVLQDTGEVVLQARDGTTTNWLFAEREYKPSDEVLKTLPDTGSRKAMTVSYAVPINGSKPLGELWAWFPLDEQTTARGIFNAPWQVNDDRTKLVKTSTLNKAMLEVCAELFLDVVVRASTPSDPAAHLDLFPARGNEARSLADMFLSDLIPRLARNRDIIPDRNGVLRGRTYFSGVPELTVPVVPVEAMVLWQKVVTRDSIPHPTSFSKARDRFTRLRTILRDNDSTRSTFETTSSAWLVELAKMRTPAAVRTALQLFIMLRDAGLTERIQSSLIVPTADGDWAAANRPAAVLIPVPGQPTPDGVSLIDFELSSDPQIVEWLHRLGFKDVSKDQIAIAMAATVKPTWSSVEWTAFWETLNSSSSVAAIEALELVSSRGLQIKVKTRTGDWRPAAAVLVNPQFAPRLNSRHVDEDLHRNRGDLLKAAGCLDGPRSDYALFEEPIYAEYRTEMTKNLAKSIRDGGHTTGAISFPDMEGAGPLQLLVELDEDTQARAAWTKQLLSTMENRRRVVTLPLTSSKQKAQLEIDSPEWWAIVKHGVVSSSLGYARPTSVVGIALREYAYCLPVVADFNTAQMIDAPRTLQGLDDTMITKFLARDGYGVEDLESFTALLVEISSRKSFRGPELIPGVSNGKSGLRARAEVVVAAPSDFALLEEHGIAYLSKNAPGAQTLVDQWGLRTSEEALSRTLEIREQGADVPVLDLFPSLASRTAVPLGRIRVGKSPAILRKSSSPTGVLETRENSARLDDLVIVDDSLDDIGVLEQLSERLGLGLSRYELESVLRDDEAMRRNELVARARAASSDPARLLALVGMVVLRGALPRGLIDAIESKKGIQSADDVADLYWKVRGQDSVWALREELAARGLSVPAQWAGSPQAQAFVVGLGFSTSYAGTKGTTKPALVQVQGQVELKPLHDFQEELASRIRDLTLNERVPGQSQRGLLYLPTGAGKTRVTVEAIVRMMQANELTGPILWIAQSQELCEQAIQAWTEVWRAIGDERVIDICRFWGGYELDESNEELQIVIAIDDTLTSRIDSANASNYKWLAEASLVVIDEAHTALSTTYTGILRWLGLTATQTSRPLLGLTATPYRGRNEAINKRFVERFGNNKLESLDPDDPIGQLRRDEVLSEVDHYVLDGMRVDASGSDLIDFTRMKEVTKSMLDRIGQDLDRMQTIVTDLIRQDESWPILVFSASVSSAHTIAALLRLEGKSAAAVDGSMRAQERRRLIDQFKSGDLQILVNCDLLTQGFDAPKVRALYIARPTFSPNRYHQMIGRGLRGPKNGGTERCLIVNMADTFEQFGEDLAFTEFDYLWAPA